MATAEQRLPHGLKPEEGSELQNMNEKYNQNATPTAKREPKGPQKTEQDTQTQQDESGGRAEKKGPEGGFDSTPVPSLPSGTIGHTLKFTFHRAMNLAMGDAHVFSSDPYVLAQLNTDVSKRHKEDPPLRFRTPTVRRSTDPEWNEEWIVANVPSSGFTLKVRVYDEDPADPDDLLGKVHVHLPSLNDGWTGIKDQRYRLAVRESSKRALLVRTIASCFGIVEHMTGELYVSIELLGRTEEDNQHGRSYTVGPCRWIRHYSSVLGRITKTKQPGQKGERQDTTGDGKPDKRVEHYNFQASQMQLPGSVPPELYHRFVEFKPWVKRMFATSGFQGVLLGKALHHQHTRVYNFGKSTEWGHFPQGACVEMTKQFLGLVHYDKGGRIFTYVLTLDALWRFTETGKEFGIDMLSKHTMHSDVSIYIAFSGEFFIRRLKHRHRPPPPHPSESTSQQHPPKHGQNEVHLPQDIEGGPPEDDPPKEPSYYELVIDNDSGTYRPNAAMLPVLAAYLSQSLPGLHVMTLDCQADAEKMAKMKSQQRERKQKEGDHIIYTQGSDSSSISSSDDEALDDQQAAYEREQADTVADGDGGARERGVFQTAAKDLKLQHHSRMGKMKRNYMGVSRDELGGPVGIGAGRSSP